MKSQTKYLGGIFMSEVIKKQTLKSFTMNVLNGLALEA
ncbi:hypothetical protein STRIC_1237 [Streptococcus ictaluri 707-05]|uniref:Uncharacterized protein n=1 Tax=Streptococcus ictaluri 707-05 TaxID=764299 RepID=G5K369_9STRE|nr:hypothetical protein STRIC_1237 [Streptococcus ictaluri 707-05]